MRHPYVRLCGYHDHPNSDARGVILKHRLVMSRHLGRPLREDEVVHHKNGNPRDNRLRNLVVKTRSKHCSEHRPLATMIKLRCAACGAGFTREARQVRTKRSQGQVDFYCGRSCAASHFGNGRKKR